MTVKCIDISHWQDFPDFEEVRSAGVIAMIHKATEGTGYTDPNRATNVSNAMQAGIECATYHWLSPDASPTAQMAHYLGVIDPVRGERVVIDYEEAGCTLDGLHEAVQALLDDPNDLQITVYSGHLLKEQLGNDRDDFLAAHTDLWLAQYTTGTPTWPAGTYPQWALWQYSETGQVPGIDDSYVDLNQFNGSDAQLLAWINPASMPQPSPPPQPSGEQVKVAIETPEGVPVRVRVNGQALRPIIRRPWPKGPNRQR
jgi:lysozyme